MGKIKLGIIGTGMAFERLHYPALQQLTDKYEISALCNNDVTKAKNIALTIGVDANNVFHDVSEMLSNADIDAVATMVPIDENYEVAHAVISSKKNLIAEKPFASDLSAARELTELAKANSVTVMVAENFRYEEENRIIKDIISQGKIGQVVYFIDNNAGDFTEDMKQNSFAAKEWRQHPKFKGGTFLDAGVHDVARMRYLFGDIDSIYATGRPQNEEFCPYSSIHSQIKFKNGVTGQYNYFNRIKETQAPYIGLRIIGTEGEIFLESKDKSYVCVSYKDGTSEQIQYTPSRGYYNELLNFYNALNGNDAIISTPEKETDDVKVIFDIMQSIETNSIVQ